MAVVAVDSEIVVDMVVPVDDKIAVDMVVVVVVEGEMVVAVDGDNSTFLEASCDKVVTCAEGGASSFHVLLQTAGPRLEI
mmetsp:Transcript_16007/g.26849  ORF Transcript_16007/g.26849 Transcript_16007/m.26849 type:complete len:80 (-) Transcript_16007:352-591(-)